MILREHILIVPLLPLVHVGSTIHVSRGGKNALVKFRLVPVSKAHVWVSGLVISEVSLGPTSHVGLLRALLCTLNCRLTMPQPPTEALAALHPLSKL